MQHRIKELFVEKEEKICLASLNLYSKIMNWDHEVITAAFLSLRTNDVLFSIGCGFRSRDLTAIPALAHEILLLSHHSLA